MRPMYFLLSLVMCASALEAAPAPRFYLELQVANGGVGMFGGLPDPHTLRLFPGESIDGSVIGYVMFAPAPSVPPGALVAALQPCLMVGDTTSAVVAGDALNCPPGSGIAWSMQPGSALFPGYDIWANVHADATTLPPGTYTLAFILNEPTLQSLLGATGARFLRSNPVPVVVGPPTTEDETLSALWRQGERAAVAHDWPLAASKATAIVDIYPSSVLALCLLGEARSEMADPGGAISSYTQALQALESNADARTVIWRREEVRERRMAEIWGALIDLGVPDPDP